VIEPLPTNRAGHHHGTARVVNHRPGPWELGIRHGKGPGGRARQGVRIQPPDSLLLPFVWDQDGLRTVTSVDKFDMILV
jgi:hypothetical protein